MKIIKYMVITALLSLAFNASAVTRFSAENWVAYAGGGTAVNLGTNYVIIPTQSKNGGQPVIRGLTCRVLLTGGATLQSYFSTNQTVITATNILGQERTNFVVFTNGFTGAQAVVIQHLKQPPRLQYEYLLVSTTQNTNQIVFASAPVTPIQIGDIINAETTGASIAIVNSGTANTAFTSPIFAGQEGEPFLITLQQAGSASATNTIDSVYAEFPSVLTQ